MVPNFGIFVPSQNLQLDKFEGADFKYENNFLKLYPKNTQIGQLWSHFLLLLLSLLFFSIFSISINSRALISNMTLAFSNFSLKYSRRASLVESLGFLFLRKTFHFELFNLYFLSITFLDIDKIETWKNMIKTRFQ